MVSSRLRSSPRCVTRRMPRRPFLLALFRRETTVLQAFRNRSMSLSVRRPARGSPESLPTQVPRQSPWPPGHATGSTLPDEQADPEDTATPSRSKRDQGGFGLDAGNREKRGIRQPFGARAENQPPRAQICRSPASSRALETRSAPIRRPLLLASRLHRRRSSRAKAGNRRNVLGPARGGRVPGRRRESAAAR